MTDQTREMVTARHDIETASATTSPDNANSGNAAYLITVVALAVLLALSVGLSGCLGTLVGASLAEEYASSDASTPDGLGDGISLEDLERLLGGGSGDAGSQDPSDVPSELSQSDALDLSLSLYDTTVDDGVDATAYAGVPSDVRSYVRSLLTADRDASSELARCLNAAARGDDDTAMQEAVEAAASGRVAIEGIEERSFGDDALDQALAEARQDTLDRWDAIASEVQLLDTDGTISYDDLESADQEVVDRTDDAAQAFSEALGSASAN